MDYLGGVWDSLKFSSKPAAASIISGSGWGYRKLTNGNLEFKNNRAYQSVHVHVSKQMLSQAATAEVNKLFPRYKKHIEKELRKEALKQQDDNRIKIIENSHNQAVEWGKVKVKLKESNSYAVITAKDKYGARVPEALMLHYEGDDYITVDDVDYSKDPPKLYSHSTKTVCFIDLSPQINIQGGKNIVKTQVQGRDCTRKELVSGGDLTFSISGLIVSNEQDVYPDKDVQKFIQLAQHTGIIQVNHFMLKQLNITQLLIESFTLSTPTCKNIQPYKISCVAIEPDESVIIAKDTIGSLNSEIAESSTNERYQMILNNKLVEIAAGAITGSITSSIGLLASDDNI